MGIRTRLIIGFLIITGFGLYYLTDWIVKELRPNYLKAMEESLVDTATLLSSLFSKEDGLLDFSVLNSAFSEAAQRKLNSKIYDVSKDSLNIRVYITNSQGIVIYDSHKKDIGKDYSKWNDVYKTLHGEYGARSTRLDPEDQNSSVIYVASPILIHNTIAGVLTVAKPAESIALFIKSAQKKVIITGILIGSGLLLFACLLSIWVTIPIHRIINFTRELKNGKTKKVPKLHAIGVLGTNEMDELAGALVEMRDALENKQYVEKYVQTLTHEIKSPLSAIKGAAELLENDMNEEDRNKFLGNILNETSRIQSMIERLLELSNLENREGLNSIESIDIHNTINEIISSLEPVIRKKELSVLLNCEPVITVNAERFLFRQSFVNCIQNAIDFSPQQGTVTITGRCDNGMVSISIEDNGPGIPEFALPKIFDRFFSLPRPQTSLKSTGLGLSFVKEAIQLHGGAIYVTNRSPNGVCSLLKWPINPAN